MTAATKGIQHIVGKVSAIKQRWEGEKYDTLVIEIDDGSELGSPISAKGKEHKDLSTVLHVGGEFAFFGHGGKYRSPSGFTVPQFQFVGFTDAKFLDYALELYDILLGRGFPKELPARLVERFQSRAAQLIRMNPYLLLEYSGVGFRRCDALWLDLGRPTGRIKRQVYYLKDAIETQANGSVWIDASKTSALLAGAVPMATTNPTKAIRLGVRSGMLASEYTDESGREIDSLLGSRRWLASKELADRESELAQLLKTAMDEASKWPLIDKGEMSTHQLEQLRRAAIGNCGCLIGGGGTGKTFTTAQLALALQNQRRRILAVAPTGKAAVRMTEAFAEYGVKVRGITIHSALFRGAFGQADAILVDESSMIDLPLMAALMQSRPAGVPILFIGDAQQLPPVGPGAPFRDMLSFLPVGELTEIRRNAGDIALAGGAIRNGEAWNCSALSSDYVDKMENNLQQFASKATLQHVIEAWHYAKSINPDWSTDDIQILGVVRQRSETSVSEINRAIQKEIYGEVDGRTFQQQDKVICTSNSWLIPSRGYGNDLDAMRNAFGQIYVANGEIGRVADVNAKRYVVHFPNPNRYVDVYFRSVHENSDEGITGCDLQLAYAITTHKSQGSQFPCTIVVLDGSGGARRMMDRSLIYTMLTRASKLCLVVGSIPNGVNACRRVAIDDRKTFLKERF